MCLDICVLPLNQNHVLPARRLVSNLRRHGIVAQLRTHHDGLCGERLKKAEAQKIPFIAMIGNRQAEQGQAMLLKLDNQEEKHKVIGQIDCSHLVEDMSEKAKQK